MNIIIMRTERSVRRRRIVVFALVGGVEQIGSAVVGIRGVVVVDLFRSGGERKRA